MLVPFSIYIEAHLQFLPKIHTLPHFIVKTPNSLIIVIVTQTSSEAKAKEELISQAKDLCILEQLSTINCSNFIDSLPLDPWKFHQKRLRQAPSHRYQPTMHRR